MSTGDVKRSFGATIRTQRVDLRLSQEELADRAGLHRTYVSDVERGARNPSLESIQRLAKALEISVSELFRRSGNGAGADPLVEILLIEDNPRDVEMTLRAFRKARIGNVIHIARDGEEALDFIFATGRHDRRKNQPLPGVILLDLNLPKLDGKSVLERIKADKRARAIPVVVLTSSSSDRDIAECRRLGATHYIVKPVGFENFSEVTPLLHLDWVLKRPLRETNGGTRSDEKGRR